MVEKKVMQNIVTFGMTSECPGFETTFIRTMKNSKEGRTKKQALKEQYVG